MELVWNLLYHGNAYQQKVKVVLKFPHELPHFMAEKNFNI